jgi:DNA-binding protein Fis
MKSDKDNNRLFPTEESRYADTPKGASLLDGKIGPSIDMLVEYLVDNDVRGIHPLIMGEVEKRLIVKVLERSRGNKLRAAKMLGISRNTFHRKIRNIQAGADDSEHQA